MQIILGFLLGAVTIQITLSHLQQFISVFAERLVVQKSATKHNILHKLNQVTSVQELEL